MPERTEDIQLRSEEVHEILTHVPHWIVLWGNLIILSVVIFMVAISWFVKYPDIVVADAIITTQTPPHKVYANVTGKFSNILVRNNQKVDSNQVLAVLENSANFQDVYKLKSIIDSINPNSEPFKFPFDELGFMRLGLIGQSYSIFQNDYTKYILNNNLDPYSNERIANVNSISELRTRLKSLQSQKQIYFNEFEFRKSKLDRNKSLLDKGVISAQEYETLQVDFLQREREYQNIILSISQIREAIVNAERIYKGAEINRAQDESIFLNAVTQSYMNLKKSIADWELNYVLISNLTGHVSFLNYWDKNQKVDQGSLVFTIIPISNKNYIAKLRAPSLNSGKIKNGQKVNIKIENYPDTEFGLLSGKVSSISMIADSEGFYYIDVMLAEKLITSYQHELVFKQEMKGLAEIITEDRRLIERFFSQLRDVVKR